MPTPTLMPLAPVESIQLTPLLEKMTCNTELPTFDLQRELLPEFEATSEHVESGVANEDVYSDFTGSEGDEGDEADDEAQESKGVAAAPEKAAAPSAAAFKDFNSVRVWDRRDKLIRKITVTSDTETLDALIFQLGNLHMIRLGETTLPLESLLNIQYVLKGKEEDTLILYTYNEHSIEVKGVSHQHLDTALAYISKFAYTEPPTGAEPTTADRALMAVTALAALAVCVYLYLLVNGARRLGC
jgi:hypothetical protein